MELLKSWGIECGLNPYSGTEDPRRAYYDIWVGSPNGYWLECKVDFRSEDTGNICIELEALRHSRAFLFIYGLPVGQEMEIHAFYQDELENLARRTKLTHDGRIYAFPHLMAGDQKNNECMLIPKAELATVGMPFEKAIRELTRTAA